MKKKKILMVDDTPTNCEIVEKILIRQGYDFVHTNNGQDAIKIFEDIEFDLVITDIRMPEMNGLDFAKKIIGIKKIPILALTAMGQNEFDTSPFSDYLRIPYKKDVFLSKVERLLL